MSNAVVLPNAECNIFYLRLYVNKNVLHVVNINNDITTGTRVFDIGLHCILDGNPFMSVQNERHSPIVCIILEK